MSGFVWDIDPERAFGDGMDAWALRLNEAIFALAQFYAPQIESWMKANAPWVDRTGNARQSLWAVASREGHNVIIEMGYGVIYAIYLEYANGGRYSVIQPALDEWGGQLGAAVQRLLA